TSHISAKVKIDPLCVRLAYGVRYDSDVRDDAFKKIKDQKTMEQLSELLIKKGAVKIESGANIASQVSNLSSVLSSVYEFDLVAIQQRHQSYAHFFDISRKLVAFLHSEGLAQEDNFAFKRLLEVVADPVKEERLSSILSI